ncbi:MAG: tetratricopeptide repeat protein [Pirellulales bacterium]|nr:tetratricopeptide repeat protein [Pirellulales bacterium]
MSVGERAPALAGFYQAYLIDQNTAVFVKAVSRRYNCGTLERLASHARREVRRAAALAIGFIGDYDSNAALGRCLVDEDRAVRTIAENGIRSLWRRVGTSPQRQQLAALVRLNTSQRYREAVDAATELIKRLPSLAEAWNQRAIAHYNLGHYQDSIRDCHETLELNPYHFDAATGLGQCHLQMHDQMGALESFRRALRLNPGLEGVRTGIEYLERALKKKSGS